jgi:hypothetical protein
VSSILHSETQVSALETNEVASVPFKCNAPFDYYRQLDYTLGFIAFGGKVGSALHTAISVSNISAYFESRCYPST